MKTLLLLTSFLTLIAFQGGCQGTAAARPKFAEVVAVDLPLVGTEWTLTEIENQPVKVLEGFKTPTLKLDEAKQQAAGIAGINRYVSRYELKEGLLKFGAFIRTKKGGTPEAMDAENLFLEVMRRVTAWKISGRNLELLEVDRKILLFAAEPASKEALLPR